MVPVVGNGDGPGRPVNHWMGPRGLPCQEKETPVMGVSSMFGGVVGDWVQLWVELG